MLMLPSVTCFFYYYVLLTLQRASKYLSRRLCFIRKLDSFTLYIIKRRSSEIGSSTSCVQVLLLISHPSTLPSPRLIASQCHNREN